MALARRRSSHTSLGGWLAVWTLACLCWLAPFQSIAAEQLSAHDIAWLNRVTYGVNTAVMERYRQVGRERFLKEQLAGKSDPLPAGAKAAITALGIDGLSAEKAEGQHREMVTRASSLPADVERKKARKEDRRRSMELARKAVERDLLLAVYSPDQLKAQMTWFWLNHFSVHGGKAPIGWTAPDYSSTVRSHALGSFRDLVLATLKHPAMLRYLDNVKNVRGKINENYARELMELHTVGVNAGYTQQDVQQLARILTGVGLVTAKSAEAELAKSEGYRHEGAFEFDPKKHERGEKTLLGHKIPGSGFDEVEAAVDILVARPACAKFIARKLALYWIGEDASDEIVVSTAKVFSETQGDIRRVLQHLLQSGEFTTSLDRPRYKDPYRFVVSSLRLAYDGAVMPDTRLPVSWLQRMAYAPFGRATPDGYPMKQSTWTGSTALMTRFDIAQSLASGALSRNQAARERKETGAGESKSSALDVRSTALFQQAVTPALTEKTSDVLKRAKTPGEGTLMLLASPEFNSY